MWRNYEFSKYHVIFIYFEADVSALFWLSQFCTLKKIRNRLCEYSKIHNFVTYQITFLMTCQQHNSHFSFEYNLVAHFDERILFCIYIQKIWSKCSIYILNFLLDIFYKHDHNFHPNIFQLTVGLSVFLLCVHGRNLYGFRPFHLYNSTKYRSETFSVIFTQPFKMMHFKVKSFQMVGL